MLFRSIRQNHLQGAPKIVPIYLYLRSLQPKPTTCQVTKARNRCTFVEAEKRPHCGRLWPGGAPLGAPPFNLHTNRTQRPAIKLIQFSLADSLKNKIIPEMKNKHLQMCIRDRNIDYYFIASAYEYIEQYFTEKTQPLVNGILRMQDRLRPFCPRRIVAFRTNYRILHILQALCLKK